jgi:hypothetical protein
MACKSIWGNRLTAVKVSGRSNVYAAERIYTDWRIATIRKTTGKCENPDERQRFVGALCLGREDGQEGVQVLVRPSFKAY